MRYSLLTVSLLGSLLLSACGDSGSNKVPAALTPLTGLWSVGSIYSNSPTYHAVDGDGVITEYDSQTNVADNYSNCFAVSNIAQLSWQSGDTFSYTTLSTGRTQDVDITVSSNGDVVTLDFGSTRQSWSKVEVVTEAELNACE